MTALFVPAAVEAQSGGQIDISLQGYYLGSSGQRLMDTSGPAARFELMLPRAGLVRGNLEGYRSQNRLRLGENFVELPALGWKGIRWGLTGGDFRMSTALTAYRFSNIVYPDLTLRGGRATGTRGNHQFSVYHGVLTLQVGPRIPYRQNTGQMVSGAEARFQFGGLEAGVSLLDTRLPAREELLAPWLNALPDYRRVRSIHGQLLYRASKHLRVSGEAGVGAATMRTTGGRTTELRPSATGGVAWESERLTVRTNYVRQSALYLPLAGYFLGDREGPFGEVRLRPHRRLEVFTAASRSRNNLAGEPSLPAFRSRSENGGFSVQAPGRFMVTGQLSRLMFVTRQRDIDAMNRADNRLLTVSLARPVGRHNLRFSLRDLRLAQTMRLDRQRSQEVEDTLQWKSLVLSGGVRLDRSLVDQRRSTLFGRGSVQVRTRRVSAYSFFESGRDLVTETMLTGSAIASTVIGMTVNLGGGWDLQAEAFRYSLRQTLNPTSAFVLQSQGVAVPASLAGLNQWSFYTRLTKQIAFGKPIPRVGAGEGAGSVAVQAPGTVEGFVFELNEGAREPVAGVAVAIDNSETVYTDHAGRYRIPRVTEGPHRVALVLEQLPAEFDPGPPPPEYIVVQPGRAARLDFSLFRLSPVCGAVEAPAASGVDRLVIYLEPGASYTTPDTEGRFCFHNLRAGSYVMRLDRSTVSEGFRLASEDRIEIRIPFSGDAPRFRIETIPVRVMTRRVLGGKQVQVTLRAGAPPAAAAPGETALSVTAPGRTLAELSLCGVVRAPRGTPVDRVLLHIVNSSHFTSPDGEGIFCFQELEAGDYLVEVLTESLPEAVRLASPRRVGAKVGGVSRHPVKVEFLLARAEPPRRAAPVRGGAPGLSKPAAAVAAQTAPLARQPAAVAQPGDYVITSVLEPSPDPWKR